MWLAVAQSSSNVYVVSHLPTCELGTFARQRMPIKNCRRDSVQRVVIEDMFLRSMPGDEGFPIVLIDNVIVLFLL